jgi:hypothetical protein
VGSRDYVALVHHGRVLLDPAGQLPCHVLEEGYPTPAEVLALVGADRFIAPSVKLGPNRYVNTVGVEGGVVPSGTWVSVADLPGDPDVTAAVVRSALEFVGEAPARRAAWFRPGWFEHAEAWVDDALARSGRTRTGPMWVDRMWCLSAVLRIPTDRGHAWFKATCEHFHGEAAITRVLAEHFPDLVPVLLAEEDDLAWLLMDQLSGAADERAPDAALALAPVFSEVQIASMDLRDELLAAGCPDRGLAHTLEGFRGVLAESLELSSLSNEEVATARAVGDEVEALVEEFWACGLPDTLSHGDLHLGNVAYDGSQLRVFDWTDACLSHPFLDGGHLARFNAESTNEHSPPDPSLAAAFADRWRTEYPEANIDRALALAPLVNLVFQAVSHEGILRGIEERSHWEVGGVVARTLRELPAKVAALRQAR